MIKIFGFRISNYHNKVLIALHEKGIAFEKELAKGLRAFKVLAKFDPFVAGKEMTLADCAVAKVNAGRREASEAAKAAAKK